ncbi:MAG TPA: glycosyltransferase family 87 protein [Terriglobales bacterium]|nr:glycosyltransferase family 87 protein [Terriglobales bacterium]
MARPLERMAAWLTERRVRRHAALLGLCLWLVYAFSLSTPGMRDRAGIVKGADFLHFYTLGTLANQGRGADLYDAYAQKAESERLVPDSKGFFFQPVHGPQMALLFAPLARLPYPVAAVLWMSISAVTYGLCCHAVWRRCPQLGQHRGTVVLLAFASPAFFNLIAHGQTSALALGFLTLGYLALEAKRPLLAGLTIGMLIYKPQLGLAAAVVFVFTGQWKVVLGAVAGAAAQLAAGWSYWGSAVMEQYGQTLRMLGAMSSVLEPKLYQMHSLRAFWMLLVPWEAAARWLYFATAGVVLLGVVWVWRTPATLPLRYSGFLLATVLVAPHLTVYDLVILAPAMLLLGNWALSNADHHWSPTMRVLLYLSYALPLLGAVTQVTHLQLSVVAFVGMAWVVVQLSAEERASHKQ